MKSGKYFRNLPDCRVLLAIIRDGLPERYNVAVDNYGLIDVYCTDGGEINRF